MYSTKIRILNSELGVLQKQILRSAAVSSTSIKVEDATVPLKSLKDIPGPPSLPIIGPLHNFLPGGMFYNVKGIELNKKMYEVYGPIVRLDSMLGMNLIVALYDAESTAQVFRGENWMPVRPGFPSLEYYRKNYKHRNEESSKPTGLITDHLEPWKEFRSAMNPVLMQPKTIRLYTNAIDQVAQDMISRMKSTRDENNMLRGQFDIEMNLWALESIAVVALGTRLNCFDPNLAEDSPAKRLIHRVNDFFNYAEALDYKPSLWKYISTPTLKKAIETYEDLENLTKYFIQKAMEELKKNGGKSNDEKGVLEKLLEINEEFAYIMAADMLFAGVDTTATTMMGTLYLLAKNPDKQQKLREEVMSKSDKKPYMRACIKESIRLMPVISGNFRKTTKDYNILGYHIPKETYVVSMHHNMSLNEENFPRATEFIPERWIVDKADPLYHGNAHPFAYAPFGFGVRMCIGRRIAELEVESFLARIVENFKVEWFGPPPKVVQAALNYVRGPFNYVFKDL
ncbi:cytochrome P450 CYP12A2 [Manduca sexta]|uniref:cytochrome P450 CYP12A2 n=1 Tax=Manduca sexta TaxID=7130 RepID=UPI00188EDD4F|nr:cytochrome P450 CYP12A2 [Manduca sexta]